MQRSVPKHALDSLAGPSLAAAFVAAAAQAHPRQAPAPVGGLPALGAEIARYEALYGRPEFRSLDEGSGKPWPPLRAIRTLGRLERIPGRGKSGEASPGQKDDSRSGAGNRGRDPRAAAGRAGDYDNPPYAIYRICLERSCLVLTPVEEMLVAFEEAATQVYLRARSVSLLRRERENESRP